MSGLRLALSVIAVAGLTACMPKPWPAPVVDRTPRGAPAAKPAPAKPVAAKAPPTAPAPQALADGTYVVRRGDTLYSIALEHGADYRDIAQWNTLEDPTKLRIGQQLRVKPPEERSVQVGRPRILGRIESRPIEGGVAAAPAAREEPKIDTDTVQFMWPARGKVLAGFAEPRSKGIDIDGKIGDPVVAAATGRVTYIGSGIPGLGKLVVIRHDNGFITVYAHNKAILVKEQQAVTRGQKIAELGNTDADRPKLHFQIRKGAAAVDPLRYLPGS
jgi:lipoprotein NlpD